MIRLTTTMDIGDYNFPFANEVEIVSSWDNLTDRATIKVPRKIRVKKNGEYSASITAGESGLWRRNDPVKIYAGYNDNNDLRFQGVLTRISPKLPLEFTCEDDMFIMKQSTISKETATTINKKASNTLRELLTLIVPAGTSFECEDIDFGKFQLSGLITVAEFLDHIKKKFGLSAYFREGVLYVGFAYRTGSIAEIAIGDLLEFEFQKNIIDDSNLDYTRDDDVKLKVIAINIVGKTRTKIEVGDPEGDIRTLHFYNLSSADLNTLANEALEKLKYEGFRGSFTTFLQPMVRHGQAVKLIDPLIPDRNGVYLVRQVITRVGMEGGRQEVTLDRKIS